MAGLYRCDPAGLNSAASGHAPRLICSIAGLTSVRPAAVFARPSLARHSVVASSSADAADAPQTSGRVLAEEVPALPRRVPMVRNVSPQDAANMMKAGWVLVDVRPGNESRRARLQGAVEVPVYLPDTSMGLPSLLKQLSAFGMGGWWLGGTHMVPNTNFIAEVQAKVPQNSKLIVCCQKGLRSLSACEQLSAAGYMDLAWMNGGLDSCKNGELATINGRDVRFGGVGGLSGVLGWTEVQQVQNSKDGSGFGALEGVFKIAGAILILDALLFVYEAYREGGSLNLGGSL